MYRSSSSPMNLKGTLPALILKTLERGPAHGYRVAQHIRKHSKGVLDFKEGTLYPALHNLEHKGLIESYEETEKGRTRRNYRLTEKGRKILSKEQEEWQEISNAITGLLEGA